MIPDKPMKIIVGHWQDVIDVCLEFDNDPDFWPSGGKSWEGRYEVDLYRKYPLQGAAYDY